MAARSPARFLAPLALLAVAVALYLIVADSLNGGSGGGASTTEQQSTGKPAAKGGSPAKKHKHSKRFYTVKPGDTPSGIAEKTGVPLSKIEKLNPGLDPQALSPGTRLKLRR
jgi:LysM repeat protein